MHEVGSDSRRAEMDTNFNEMKLYDIVLTGTSIVT